jgi:hypothetical protein
MFENEIIEAVRDEVILDKRKLMPRGKVPGTGEIAQWTREREVRDVLGCCVHQNGGNDRNPKATANYHTSEGHHVTKKGDPLPSICYPIVIPDLDTPAWLCANLEWVTYAQGKRDSLGYPGDENLHLIPVLVMGDFNGPGHRGTEAGPSTRQWEAFYIVLDWLKNLFRFDNSGVFGHYHFGKAACPGYDIQEEIELMRSEQKTLDTATEWQDALMNWDPNCLPKYGVDGSWGGESKRALVKFQRNSGLRVTGSRDPFTEIVLRKGFVDH